MKNVLRRICFFAFMLATGWGMADESRIQSYASSPQWLRLLQIKPRGLFGNLRSEITEGNFFLSPQGATDPAAELSATLAAFREDRRVKSVRGEEVPARCAFPARWEILRRDLDPTLPDVPCPELAEFLGRLNARSLTLVFSSSYPNSPPSMFGHTFFRVNSAGGDPLADLGINYAAAADGADGGATFAIYGVFGGFYGHFSIDPYYLKVNEYNHAESRDLWEYDLNLSPAETRLVLLHVWELDRQVLFRYYFFVENCSYRLLTLLEVARPDWTLSDFRVQAIPGETVKRVMRTPGAVGKIGFRASIRRQLRFDFANLTEARRELVQEFIAGRSASGTEKDAAVLDALIGYYRYRTFRDGGKLAEPDLSRQQTVLRWRSRLAATPPRKVAATDLRAWEGRPDEGHGPYRLSISGGVIALKSNAWGFGELGFKLAYHDLWSNDRGYTRWSQVDFPQLRIRYSPANAWPSKIWIEQLGLANVTSLFPFTALEKRVSWSAHADYGVPKDLGCGDCHTFAGGGAAGLAVDVWEGANSELLFYSLLGARLEAGSTLAGFVRGGPDWKSAMIWEFASRLKVGVSGVVRTDLFQTSRQLVHLQTQGDASWSLAREWEIRAQALRVIPMDQARGEFQSEYRLGLYKTF